MEIVIATTNKGKFKEISSFFARELPEIDLLSLKDFPYYPVVEEDGKTVEENAVKKAVEYSKFFGLPVIAEDSALEVDALGGRPGIYSSRYGSDDRQRISRVLRELEGVPEGSRSAQFRCVTVFAVPGGKRYISTGVVEGRILTEPVGSNGFGYDPIFFVDAFDKTFAQLLPEQKEEISHRGSALRGIVKFVKLYLLQEVIRHRGKVAVAFSGGMDSTFLLAVARDVSRDVVALFVDTPYIVEEQRISVQLLSHDMAVKLVTLKIDGMELASVMENTKQRCYLCKKAMYSKMLSWCEEGGYQLLDGTNLTDTHHDRPGIVALRELGVYTPMLEVGLEKEEITSLCEHLRIPLDTVYSNTCLLTRFPFGFSPSICLLRGVERVEAYLKLVGFSVIRVRVHDGGVCRIQVGKNEIDAICGREISREIVQQCKDSGFEVATLDLEGYAFGR